MSFSCLKLAFVVQTLSPTFVKILLEKTTIDDLSIFSINYPKTHSHSFFYISFKQFNLLFFHSEFKDF